MQRKKESSARKPSKGGRGRVAQVIAKGTLLASLAASQWGSLPDVDTRFRLFSSSLVDRLHEPITRLHE